MLSAIRELCFVFSFWGFYFFYLDKRKMVPQQVSEVRSLTPTSSGVPVFGSQLVDKNSSTPYTDATQVSVNFIPVT